MLVAHLSDLHLGHRAYGGDEGGRSPREQDVERALAEAVHTLIGLGPDLVVLSGDLFDHPEPPPSAFLALTRSLEALRSSLPGLPVLAVAGSRDTPGAPAEAGPLATLDTLPGVEAVVGAVRSVRLDELGAHVLLVPHRALSRKPGPKLEPDPDARWNVLVLRGEPDPDGHEVRLQDWDYVALGGRHGHGEVADRAWIAGSLERVGPEPWSEATEDKGFITCDLESGRVHFHVVRGRPVVDLAPTRVDPGHPAAINERIQQVVEGIPGGVEGKIVRLRIGGLATGEQGLLDHRYLARTRERALHLHVEVREEPWEPDGPGPPTPEIPSPAERLEEWLRRVPEVTDELRARALEVAAKRLEQEIPSAPQDAAAPEVLDLNHPALGDASLAPPSGLVAVVSDDHRLRHALFEALRATSDDVAWSEEASPARALEALTHDLARRMGLDDLEAALESSGTEASDQDAGAPGGVVASTRSEMKAELDRLDARLREVRKAPGALRALERDLTELRASAAEVTGDLEFKTMEWLRERQDAETQLQAYRDRARELRSRIREIEGAGDEAVCPTCGRLLDDHTDDVLATLKEEWESVVQDGRWWKRRREQLDPKPEHLQELERQSIRLQAAIEELAERMERRRAGLDDPATLEEREAELRRLLAEAAGGSDGAGDREEDDETPRAGSHSSVQEAEGPEGLVNRALDEVSRGLEVECRELLLHRGGSLLGWLSGGYFTGLCMERDRIHLLQDGARAPVTSEPDRALIRLALHMAWAAEAAAAGRPVSKLVVGPAVDRLEGDVPGRAVEALGRLAGVVERILLITRGALVDSAPEAFAAALQLRAEEAPGRTTFRALPIRSAGVKLV